MSETIGIKDPKEFMARRMKLIRRLEGLVLAGKYAQTVLANVKDVGTDMTMDEAKNTHRLLYEALWSKRNEPDHVLSEFASEIWEAADSFRDALDDHINREEHPNG